MEGADKYVSLSLEPSAIAIWTNYLNTADIIRDRISPYLTIVTSEPSGLSRKAMS